MKKKIKAALAILLLVTLALFVTGCAAQTDGSVTGGLMEQLVALLGSRSATLQIIGVMTILTIAPSILIMLTGFTRIVIVLSFTRNAMGTQQMPPNQVLIGLALILTFFVMTPTFTAMYEEAYQPYINQEINEEQAISAALNPIRTFMLKQTYKSDLEMFMSFTDLEAVETVEQVPTRVVLPAFITSEIKRGFQIGFFIYIPFIVIDMIVASTLMSMGMMMLPPVVISLPFKVLLFISIDGWMLTMQTLVASFL